jgi:putative transposase
MRSVFNTTERGEANERLAKLVEKDQRLAPKLAEWMEANVSESLAVFALPEPHRQRLRTTNSIERYNSELRRRRTRRHAVPERGFPRPPLAADGRRVSEDWETGRIY